jgi:hypothetical protein
MDQQRAIGWRADAPPDWYGSRLVASISRFPDTGNAVAAVAASEGGAGAVEVLDCQRMGGACALDRLSERLGIGAAIRTVAAGRKIDPGAEVDVPDELADALRADPDDDEVSVPTEAGGRVFGPCPPPANAPSSPP